MHSDVPQAAHPGPRASGLGGGGEVHPPPSRSPAAFKLRLLNDGPEWRAMCEPAVRSCCVDVIAKKHGDDGGNRALAPAGWRAAALRRRVAAFASIRAPAMRQPAVAHVAGRRRAELVHRW